MPISTKVRAEYVELIAQQLDNIPVDSLEDFDLVQQALQNIIRPEAIGRSIAFTVPEKYQERMFAINDYLQEPGDYVQDEVDYEEYKQIIRDRITAKINELQSFDSSQKETYIKNQQGKKVQAAVNQEIMTQHRPPQQGSERHVLTEEQWHTQEQARFAADFQSHRPQHVQPAAILATLEVRQQAVELAEGLFTVEDISGIRRDVASKLIKPECLAAIRERLFTGADFTRITDGNVASSLIKPECLAAIREGRTTIDLLINMTANDLYHAIQTGEYPNIPRLGM